jgi:hypothetical protein
MWAYPGHRIFRHEPGLDHGSDDILRRVDEITIDNRPVLCQLVRRVPILVYDFHLFHNRRLPTFTRTYVSKRQ